jgi:hypothetical protein
MNPQAKVTPKDFFLWLGAMAALYTSVFSIITLYFAYIDKLFPDALDYYSDPYSGTIRFAIASLVVLFPALLFLMRLIRTDIARDTNKKDLWVRRWALYLTLFIAGVTIVVDLIALINSFLGGDITTRFTLKVAVILLVMALGFWYFLHELKGYWDANTATSRSIGYGIGALLLLSIAGGFYLMGSPLDIREQRFDEERISHLQSIQWQMIDLWQRKEALPADLEELNDPISGFIVPLDPATSASYEYERTSNLSFKLCATFSRASQEKGMSRITYPAGDGLDPNWSHEAGRTCFERTIDPERYPPYKTIELTR